MKKQSAVEQVKSLRRQLEESRNRTHEIGVDRDTWQTKFHIGELKQKSMHEDAVKTHVDHYNEKERLIDILRGCKNQLEQLNKRNDILEAKVSVIDSFNRAMNGTPYSCGAEQPDITYYLADVIAGHENDVRIQNACCKESENLQKAYQESGPANCKSPDCLED